MEQTAFIRDILRMLRRRAILIVLVALPGILIAALIAFILPPKYQTTARILVESQQIPDDLARSTVTSTAFERIKLIEQRLMARDNLSKVIDDLDLYTNRPDLLLADRVEALRDATVIRAVPLGQSNPRSTVAVAAFEISVTFGSPGQAVAIANRLVDDVLTQNIQTRTERAEQTLSFFETEVERLSREMAAVELEATKFRTDNEAALPESREYRQEELARLIELEQKAQQTLLGLREEQISLEEAIRYGDEAEEDIVRQLEAELAVKRASLAESHPDVRTLRTRIEMLKEAAASARESADATGDGRSRAQRTLDRQASLVAGQIELLEQQIRSNAERRTFIEETLRRTPSVEANLDALGLRRSQLLTQYEDAVAKRAEAAVGQKLEVARQAERLEVIEQAAVPDEPISPNRKKIMMFGIAAAFAAAFGFAFLLEMLSPSIRTSSQMLRQLNIAPIVAIPVVRTRTETVRRRLVLYSTACLICVSVPAGIWAIDQYVRPVQVILDRIYDRSGLEEIVMNMRTRL